MGLTRFSWVIIKYIEIWRSISHHSSNLDWFSMQWYIGFFHFSMHIIFQSAMMKTNLFVLCALVSFMRLHRLETHDNRGYLHDILGYFCILKGAYHSLSFLHTQEGEPGSECFPYLRGHTIVYRFRYHIPRFSNT
jgi:hypothetical protein